MADKKHQKGSQQFYNTTRTPQQQHLNNISKNSTTNNDPGKFECVRDEDRKIFVGSLDRKTTKKDLNDHFGQFGEIKYNNIMMDAVTGQCRGFAFIEYKTNEGQDNALACTHHVINDKKIYPQKCVQQPLVLFVGGLTSDLTENDIKDYFNQYAHVVHIYMPKDNVKNQRKGFCFVTFESSQAVTKILKMPRHVINGKRVDVEEQKSRASEPMKGIQRNVGGHGGSDDYNWYTGHSPDYIDIYDNQHGGSEPSAPHGQKGTIPEMSSSQEISNEIVDFGVFYLDTVLCPLNPNHKVKRHRLTRHISLCKNMFPNKIKCPHGHDYYLEKHEMASHLETCIHKPQNPKMVSVDKSRNKYISYNYDRNNYQINEPYWD